MAKGTCPALQFYTYSYLIAAAYLLADDVGAPPSRGNARRLPALRARSSENWMATTALASGADFLTLAGPQSCVVKRTDA
eukprot:scaffold191704_cov35-Prasinocladus_malaysianus.AAC.1